MCTKFAGTLLSLFLITLGMRAQTERSLAGRWAVTLEDAEGKTDSISLPGTLDTHQLGSPTPIGSTTTHLTRRFTYAGAARYERTIDIPKAWARKDIFLHLERTKPTTVYVDGRQVSYKNNISTPQVHPLGKLKAGRHRISLLVDNSRGLPRQLYASSHAVTEDTQTNWNGVIGELFLSTSDSIHIQLPEHVRPEFRDFRVEGQHFSANGHLTFLRGKHDACVWPLTGHVPMDLASWMDYLGRCQSWGINHIRFHSWCPPEAAFRAADSMGIYLQPELPFWGDFNRQDTTLMSYLWQEGEAIVRTYGRHPSFRMMALGNELWGSIEEMTRLVEHLRTLAPDKLFTFGSNYYLGFQGVKPGMDYFTTCRVGGEKWGSTDTHTRGSFSFADAFEGGMLNAFRPNSTMNFDEACLRAKAGPDFPLVPVISHETGQFQTYPDYDAEMPKYTGVLRPDNFAEFMRRAESAGIAHLAPQMHVASGRWAAQQYKADIEMDLRTRHMAGYQLLDLQDYPGQGTALVGLLDAFMETKGIISPEEWAPFTQPVVPLLVAEAFCFAEEGDSIHPHGVFQAQLQVANYGGSSLAGRKLRWELMGPSAASTPILLASGEVEIPEGEGLLDVGQMGGGTLTVAQLLNKAAETLGRRTAIQATLRLSISESNYRNSYPLWFYPTSQPERKDVIETRDMSKDIVEKMERGASVLWTPDTASFSMNTVGGLFTSDYWNYRMFRTISENNNKPVSPGTLSILTDGAHPIFSDFPSDGHTSWQWWCILRAAHPLILSGALKQHNPIVRMVDNIERSHPLGLIMEFRVGKGKLLICMANLAKTDQWPEGRAFHTSILRYMQSANFNPSEQISFDSLLNAMSSPTQEQQLERLNNISPYQ